ncbi:MAG: ABC transporter ATP-binding protein/permease [Turicibacter sp.]|nr:ABC transporter ATP-binding protein/permease [Turicibacter sp.]
MLLLKDIVKDYHVAGFKQHVLKGINLNFRENEFVSILGPSGSGKTTLLNIIGGLDHYTTGDLVINGVSTQQYQDADWDTYRNQSIGFVFQSYNLIPHQTVLANVELALTLAGVSKKERKARAIAVLKQVGLEEHLYKKPNQMSGGQMQRVAIARALINNPDILLADEPTGALDTETSVQVMNLLKEIAKEKLVIMVTHNPELAEAYSTRIIRLLDGKIQDDTNPLSINEDEINPQESKNIKQVSMTFLTALSLSFNNLRTKKGRTILTAFAGSIGIIGIALILSLSSGMRRYISSVEEDTLSSYPITISEQGVDLLATREKQLNSLLNNMSSEEVQESDRIYQNGYVADTLQLSSISLSENNLTYFKEYLESEAGEAIRNQTNAIQYGYGLELQIYKSDTSEGVVQVNPSPLLETIGSQMMMDEALSESMGMTSFNIWAEMIDNKELLESQYDVIAGRWPQAYNELVVVVNEDNEISDVTLYALGLKDSEEFAQIQEAVQSGEDIDYEQYPRQTYTYDEILGLEFSVILNSDYYEKVNDEWIDRSLDENYLSTMIQEKSIPIQVVGIIRPAEGAISTTINGSIAYSTQLIEQVISQINESEIVLEQKNNPTINIFTQKEFATIELTDQEALMNQLTDEQKMILSMLSEAEQVAYLKAYADTLTATYENNLNLLGANDLKNPASILLYLKDFNARDVVTEAIEQYNNEQVEAGNDENTIEYTDMVGLMTSSMTTVIDMITYLLVGFVSISLVVSSIMIGIITYISVLERTKEIGILRSIGASKRDISRVFNAETVIVGFTAGVIGIGVTILLNIPINAMIKTVSGVEKIASLPISGAIILIIISVVLTMISGLIPSRIAAKKNPVIALRSE